MLPRRQSEFTTRKGVWWWFCFLTILKVTKKVRLSTQSTCDFPVWHLFLQVHRTCGSVWLQDEKLVPVQMATSSIMSAWYDPSGITADHPSPRPSPQMANSQNGENILPHGNASCRQPSDPRQKWKTRLNRLFSDFFLTISLFSPHIVCLDFWTRWQLNIQYSGSGDNWQRQPIIDPARLFREPGIVQICSRHGLMAILLRNSFRGDSCLMWRRGVGGC